MDKKYWNNYYYKKNGVDFPTPFASFCMEKYFSKKLEIIEIGCGNGRDSKFFAQNGLIIHSIDQSDIVINNNINQKKKTDYDQNLKYYANDFTQCLADFSNIDAVYSRFSLHSINENQQNKVFQQVFKLLKIEGLFLFECRTKKDPLFNEGESLSEDEKYTDHYRRFIDSHQVKNYLIEKVGFKLEYFVESNDLAIYNDENPVVARFVLKK